MQNRALMIALLCAVVAAVAHFAYLKKKGEEWKKDWDPVNIVVAKMDIPEGKQIDTSMLTLKPIPKIYKQPEALTKIAIAEGQYSKAPILKGEQILDSKLAGPGETWVSLNIPEEMRACSISISEVSGVAGLIRPGNRVDVTGIFRITDPKTKVPNDIKAKTLFQNKQVLSIGHDYAMMSPMAQGRARKGGGFSTVTLALTLKQCQDLALAQQIGTISLSLRSFFDRGKIEQRMKDYYSTTFSVTGLKNRLEISAKPKWLELRGQRSLSVY